MAKFEHDQWYHLWTDGNKDQGFKTTNLFINDTYGATGYDVFDTKNASQRWQFYLVDSDYYVLRTRHAGEHAFLGAYYDQREETVGKTRARMVVGDKADDSIYWKVTRWDDRLWGLSNKANNTGFPNTKWYLSDKAMEEDSDATHSRLRWDFEQIGEAVDQEFLTVQLPSTTVSSAASATPIGSTSSPTSNPGTSDSSDPGPTAKGLTSGTKSAIGGAIGGIVLIALVVLGLWLWRRRRRDQVTVAGGFADKNDYSPREYNSHFHGMNQNAVKYEMNHDSTAKYELPDTGHRAELLLDQPPAELPSSPLMNGAR